MSDERPLAEGYECGVLTFTPDTDIPCRAVYCKETGDTWPLSKAPPECFADPAPAPDDALKAGDTAWVQDPDAGVKGVALMLPTELCDWENGWADVRYGPSIFRVRRAACHREGPSGPPPAEGAVFLGRFLYGTSYGPSTPTDAWCANGRIFFGDLDSPGCLPELIEKHKARSYIDALAVARDLGLVEAEAGAERPEQKFVVGQWMEADRRGKIITGAPGPIISVHWSEDDNEWWYNVQVPSLGVQWAMGESQMRPHALTIADVPNEVKLAIFDGKPVRVVDVPVDSVGIPLDLAGEPNCSTVRCVGEAVTPSKIGLDKQAWVDIEETGGSVQAWNLTLAKPGE